MRTKQVLGQDSWELSNAQVHAFITRTGGHLGPVTFRVGSRRIEPFSIAPWHSEKLDRSTPPIIRVLRGDFFCMPFGGNATVYRGERHPVHGEVANANWTFVSKRSSRGRTTLRLALETRIRKGHVAKQITLVRGHPAVYSRHIVSGMSGAMTVGHHAMLNFPDRPNSGRISTSRFLYGQVFPEPVELPENRGYSILQPGATFDALESVPTILGRPTDLSRYPARRGFEDLVMMTADDTAPFAWTAVVFERDRYLWLAIKDPRVLRSTVLWVSNGGRHYPPWNGRHVNVMGLEEVTANFHLGLAESACPNAISDKGFATTVTLSPRKPLTVNYIMAVAEVGRGFDRVASVEPGSDGLRVIADSGKSARVPMHIEFLTESELE